VLYCYEKMFRNQFVILAIHKFCYFNLVILPLYCNHQYHADFDICHDLYGLIIGEHIPHMPEKFSRTLLVIVVVGCGVQNNPRVVDVGDNHEPPCLTMDSTVQLLWTASKRWLRGSLSYTAAHATT
jgi:hypothetical protein